MSVSKINRRTNLNNAPRGPQKTIYLTMIHPFAVANIKMRFSGWFLCWGKRPSTSDRIRIHNFFGHA